MHILLVSEYFPPVIMGGGEINVFSIARALVSREINVSVLTSKQDGLLVYERIDGIQVYRRLKTGKNPQGITSNLVRGSVFPRSVEQELKIFLEEKEIDLIHFMGTSVIAASAMDKYNIPLIATIESYPTLCPKGDRMFEGKEECTITCSYLTFLACQQKSIEVGKMKNKFYLKYNPLAHTYIYNYYAKLHQALPHCNLIAISEYLQQLLSKQGFTSTIVPNFVEEIGTEITTTEEKPITVLYLGSLTHFKGAHILLEALKGLPYHCALYGEGTMKETLSQKIKEYQLNAEIFSPVPNKQVISLYGKADIIVFPSLWPEPFGRIAIEAMALSKPVIGSAIGGIKETLQEGGGILVPAGNVDELRAAIVKLAEDKALRTEIGEQGKRIVQEKYTEEIVINKLINFYQSIINSKSKQ